MTGPVITLAAALVIVTPAAYLAGVRSVKLPTGSHRFGAHVVTPPSGPDLPPAVHNPGTVGRIQDGQR